MSLQSKIKKLGTFASGEENWAVIREALLQLLPKEVIPEPKKKPKK